MARYERVAEIYDLLAATQEPQSLDSLCAALGAAPATVKRLIRFVRDELGAEVRFDREQGGYVLDRTSGAGPLLGPSYGARELSALLTAHELLAQIPPGVFKRETAALRAQLQSLLYKKPTGSREVQKRVRLRLPQVRELCEDVFRTVIAGLSAQRRLRVRYRSRYKGEERTRTVSPLRLTFYRSNWYLAAWCHSARDLRVFSLDRIATAEPTPLPNQPFDEEKLEARLSSGYGIFEGKADQVAKLKFSPAAARWVADEEWHPEQATYRQPDGGVILHVPYRHATELLMDVLRYGADVEVLGPPELRREVAKALAAAAARYAEPYAKVADLPRAS
ncbi:MAG: WYL domain-containing protein [Steroidobacteraceae bacterium]|jgi:predicted DNA-binding transcriptional regulator YafY|nr:WYL domain-containing protein [Steroidobacteraceae bacterium]